MIDFGKLDISDFNDGLEIERRCRPYENIRYKRHIPDLIGDPEPVDFKKSWINRVDQFKDRDVRARTLSRGLITFSEKFSEFTNHTHILIEIATAKVGGKLERGSTLKNETDFIDYSYPDQSIVCNAEDVRELIKSVCRDNASKLNKGIDYIIQESKLNKGKWYLDGISFNHKGVQFKSGTTFGVNNISFLTSLNYSKKTKEYWYTVSLKIPKSMLVKKDSVIRHRVWNDPRDLMNINM